MSIYLLTVIIGILADQTLAGCTNSKLASCFGQSERPPPKPPAPGSTRLNKCPNGIPKTWACLDPKLAFPTVDCIVQDIKTCGTLKANPPLFYSFGARPEEARKRIRDTLKPQPVMFNDVLPDDWVNKITSVERFGLKEGHLGDPDAMKRNQAYVQRTSAAIAKAATGEVIIVVKNRESTHGGTGAYSNPDPKDSNANVWTMFEFPFAQRNPAVPRVVSYALDETPLKRVVEFEPGVVGKLLPEPRFPDPPLPKKSAAASSLKAMPSSSKPTPTSSKPATSPSKPTPKSSKPTPGSSKPVTGPSKPATGPSKPAPRPTKPKTGKKPSRKTRASRRQDVLNARI